MFTFLFRPLALAIICLLGSLATYLPSVPAQTLNLFGVVSAEKASTPTLIVRSGQFVSLHPVDGPVYSCVQLDEVGSSNSLSFQHDEEEVLRRGIAQRLPGESDTTFLKRVFPVSFSASSDLVTYAWRPSSFGKQLFFSVQGSGDNEYGRDLFVLDPFQANTYAVQVLTLESMGDLTDLAALFFADVDHNGQKELLTLLECSLREPAFKKKGQQYYGRVAHYQTLVFQFVGLSSAGRPQYKLDATPCDYLDELPTAAAVRQALAQHQQKVPQAKEAIKILK